MNHEKDKNSRVTSILDGHNMIQAIIGNVGNFFFEIWIWFAGLRKDLKCWTEEI